MPESSAKSPRIPSAECIVPAVDRGSGRLGRRELEVLDVVWAEGGGTVQQVSGRLSMQLAYTTVMTTLDRLFKKGLLHRVKRDRAFLYSPAASPAEVERLRARSLIDRFFDGRAGHQDLLLSCLVDVLGQHDEGMLDRLEDKVKAARMELNAASAAAAASTARTAGTAGTVGTAGTADRALPGSGPVSSSISAKEPV